MKDVFLPYLRTGLHGYYGLATAGAWDLSGPGKSVLFCDQIGHVVYYRYIRAQLRENCSSLGKCHPGLYQQGLHRDETRQGK